MVPGPQSRGTKSPTVCFFSFLFFFFSLTQLKYSDFIVKPEDEKEWTEAAFDQDTHSHSHTPTAGGGDEYCDFARDNSTQLAEHIRLEGRLAHVRRGTFIAGHLASVSSHCVDYLGSGSKMNGPTYAAKKVLCPPGE